MCMYIDNQHNYPDYLYFVKVRGCYDKKYYLVPKEHIQDFLNGNYEPIVKRIKHKSNYNPTPINYHISWFDPYQEKIVNELFEYALSFAKYNIKITPDFDKNVDISIDFMELSDVPLDNARNLVEKAREIHEDTQLFVRYLAGRFFVWHDLSVNHSIYLDSEINASPDKFKKYFLPHIKHQSIYVVKGDTLYYTAHIDDNIVMVGIPYEAVDEYLEKAREIQAFNKPAGSEIIITPYYIQYKYDSSPMSYSIKIFNDGSIAFGSRRPHNFIRKQLEDNEESLEILDAVIDYCKNIK